MGATKSVPLEMTQLCRLKGVPLGPIKEKNASGTVSPQVQSTHMNYWVCHPRDLLRSCSDTPFVGVGKIPDMHYFV